MENIVRTYLREIGTQTLHVYDAWMWIRNDACTECESRRVYTRKPKTTTYRCGSCGAEFDAPVDATSVYSEIDLPDYLGDEKLTDESYGPVKRRLEELHENGAVERKTVGGGTTIWW